MRLEKYAASQYAGTHDREIAFRPGMNVVLGDNETGKSTMISGIMDALLRPAKVDKRSGKDFLQRRFPTNDANYIDGEVQLELAGKRVTVRKEWDRKNMKESRVVLQYLDSGKRVTGATAEQELRELLQYGDAVYQKIIFGRQDNEEDILDWLFSFLEDGTGDGLAEAKERVAGAAAAAGGISEDLFLARLEDKLEELGSHWDFALDRPEGGRGLSNRWKNKVGGILTAYYTWQEKAEAYEKGEALIRRAAETEGRLGLQRERKRQLAEQQETLQKQQTAIRTAGLLRQQQDTLAAALGKLSDDSGRWPGLREEKALLEGLLAEDAERLRRKEKSTLEKTLEEVRSCGASIAACRTAIEGRESIEADARACRTLQNRLEGMAVRLAAGRLTARVVLEGDHRARVETADGQVARDVQTFDGAVSGYAQVAIPGVGEVTVTPGDLDVDGLRREREETQRNQRNLLEKYGLETCEDLEQAAAAYRESKAALERQEGKRETLLDGRTEEALAAALGQLETAPGLVVGEDLDRRIRAALASCRESTLESRAAVVAKQLADLETEYGSSEELELRRAAAREALAKARAELDQVGQIPMTREAYDQETGRLAREQTALEETLEATIREYASLTREADALDPESLRAERSAWEEQLEAQKRLYHQYERIREDFLRIRQEQADQYGEFYALFNRYLAMAAGEGLRIDRENAVVSGNHTLTGKELLSQGTRKTILLAFRLALLKYYYRSESGVVVLDDVLLDMDPGRRRGAAKLLAGFAEENQVIFTTCDPAIAELLGGNRIEL